jgi:hypothetical protein
MDRQKPFHGFDFDNELVLNDDVHPVSAFELNPLVEHGQRYLTAISDAGLFELETQAFFINRFEQPRADLSMHIHCRPDDALTQLTAVGKPHLNSSP